MVSTPEPMKIYGFKPTLIYQMAIESQTVNETRLTRTLKFDTINRLPDDNAENHLH